MLSENKYHLSPRADASLHPPAGMRQILAAFANAYDPETNPDGIVLLGIAENALVSNLLISHFNANFSVTPKSLTYGAGPAGSPQLHTALARFLNRTLHPLPANTLAPTNLHVSAGASAILDQLAYALCAPATEGMLLSTPYYTGFINDLAVRSRAVPIFVDFDPTDLHPVQGATEHIVARYEAAYQASVKNGVRPTALLICNPHNPLGCAYPASTLEALLRFAARHKMHYVSDEIYQQSVYGEPEVPFTSVLALDLEKIGIGREYVHVVYGMSKDFGANGLRLGCLASFNEGLLKACAAVGVFGWPSSPAEACWTKVLEDEEFLERYFAAVRTSLLGSWLKVKGWLEERGIEYIGKEAKGGYGFFIWADFSRWLSGKGERKGERELTQCMLDGGVYLATGEAFGGREGWYRITFSVSQEFLELGLGRLEKALETAREKHGKKVEGGGLMLERGGEGAVVE